MLPYSNRRHLDPVADALALEVRDLNVEYPGSRRLALHHVNLRAPGVREWPWWELMVQENRRC